MTSDQIGQVIYLGLLGAVIGGYFLVANRKARGRLARHATLWGLIFVGVIAAYGLWSDISDDVRPVQRISTNTSTTRVEVPRAMNGHYYLTLQVNDTPVRFVVDTGASDIVLGQDDARRLGFEPDTLRYVGQANTANGVVRTAPVRLERIRLGDLTDTDLRAVVLGGDMDGSLLGMSYLQRFSRIELAGNALVLER